MWAAWSLRGGLNGLVAAGLHACNAILTPNVSPGGLVLARADMSPDHQAFNAGGFLSTSPNPASKDTMLIVLHVLIPEVRTSQTTR